MKKQTKELKQATENLAQAWFALQKALGVLTEMSEVDELFKKMGMNR